MISLETIGMCTTMMVMQSFKKGGVWKGVKKITQPLNQSIENSKLKPVWGAKAASSAVQQRSRRFCRRCCCCLSANSVH